MVLAAIAVPVALALGASATLPSFAKEFKKNIETKENQRTIETPEYREVARAGYTGLETRPQGFVDKFVSALPLAPQLDERTRLTFFRAAEEKAKALGYSDKEANRLANLAVRADLYPGSFGELGALVYGSIASEQVGEQAAKQFASRIPVEKLTAAATKSFNPFKNPLAAAAIKGVAPAGFLEGGSDVIASELATRAFERRTPEQILLNVGLGGAAGAVTAGVFAVPTTGQILARPRLSKASQYVGYLIDPLEYPGDVGQRVLARRLGEKGFTIPVRGVNVAGVGTLANVLGESPSVSGNVQSAVQSNVNQNVSAQSQANVATNLTSLVGVNTTNNVNTRTRSTVNVPSNLQTNINDILGSNTFTNANVASNVDEATQAQSETNENVNANVAANVAVGVNTQTPIFRGFVPLPPLFGFPTGGGGRGGRGKPVLYFDELGRAFRLLNRTLR